MSVHRFCFPLLALALGAPSIEVEMTLERALEIALQRSPTLATASEVQSAARARVRQSRAPLLPRVDARFDTTRIELDSTATVGGVRQVPLRTTTRVEQAPVLAVQQLVTDFGRTTKRVSAAKAAVREAGNDLRAADLDVVVNVKVAFHALAAAQRRLSLARVAIGQREALLETSRVLVEQGVRSQFDITRAELALADAQVAERQAQLAVDTAQQDLLNALGAPELPPMRARDVLEPRDGGTPFPDENQALAVRPELAAQQNRVEARARLLESARAQYLPVITGVATRIDRRTDVAARSLDDDETTVTGQVDLPIFHGLAIRGQVAETRADLRAEQNRFEALRQALLRDIRTAALNHGAARDRVVLVRRLVKAADDNVALVNDRYEQGFSTIIEVIDAQTSLTGAQGTLIDALLAERVAYARRERAVGRR